MSTNDQPLCILRFVENVKLPCISLEPRLGIYWDLLVVLTGHPVYRALP